MILAQKIIRGLTTQIENQFKSLDEMYRYSTQRNPCFSNFIFAHLPILANSSNLIDDILMATEIGADTNDDSVKDEKSGKLVFEHFLDYTVNCFDQLFFDFYSNESSSNDSENKQGKSREIVSFFDLIRFHFYSSILSVLTSENNIKFLVFTPSMYSSFLKKFPDFLTNNITLYHGINELSGSRLFYMHEYNSIQNVFNSLSRFNIDIFKDYLNENDSKGRGINLLKICDDAALLVQNKQSLLSFAKDLSMMLEIGSSINKRNEFLKKLFQFFMNLFTNNPTLYTQILDSNDEIIQQFNIFFRQILKSYHIDFNSTEVQDSTIDELIIIFPLLCVLFPFLYRNSNFKAYKDFIFTHFKYISEKSKQPSSSKDLIFCYLNSFIALFQSVLLTPDSKNLISVICQFVDSHKSDFDTFLFKYDFSQTFSSDDGTSTNVDSISSGSDQFEVVNSTLPRYLALDVANESNIYDEKSSSSYSITQSVSFCTQTSNIYYSLSLIRGLLLLIKGYPLKRVNPFVVQIILNLIFNIVNMYKSPSLNSSNSSITGTSSSVTEHANSSNNNVSIVASINNINPNLIDVSNYKPEMVDILHREVYELISGHTFSNEYNLIPTFLDLIASENSTSLAFYQFMVNEVRSGILDCDPSSAKDKRQNMTVTDFSPDTIASFFILLIAAFDKPSRWSIFALESTSTNRFLLKVNRALLKLYEGLLKKNITALFAFDTVIVKYLTFVREIAKISKNGVAIDRFIDHVQQIVLLMNATSDKLNSEYVNDELKKLALEFKVPFYYQWPLCFSTPKSAPASQSPLSKGQIRARNRIPSEKVKEKKEQVLMPVVKFCYLLWFEATLRYLYQNNFIVNSESNTSSKLSNVTISNWTMKSNISFQVIVRMTSFLCQYSSIIDEIQPLLTKHAAFKNAKIKFANAFLDFISHDIKDDMFLFITNSVPFFDRYTSNMLLKIIRSNLVSSSNSFSFSCAFLTLIKNGFTRFKHGMNESLSSNSCLSLHSNCYLFISELINEENLFYNEQSYLMCEEIILNLVNVISMDKKFKTVNNSNINSPTNNSGVNDEYSVKSILFSISNILCKFYGYNRKEIKSSQIARLSIISTILNYMITTQNSIFSVIIAKPLPRLFKDFVITAEGELSGSISSYDNLLFVRKTIDNFFSFFFLILSSNDKSSLFSVCQESLENILLANYKEAVDIFVSSLLIYSKSDFFSKVILKSFISVIKKSPEILNYSLKQSSPNFLLDSLCNDLRNNTFGLVTQSHINSIHFYEAIIEYCSYQNKLSQLFIAICKSYRKSDNFDDPTFYEKVNSPFFFIAFFKFAATSQFINSFSGHLFKMSVEKITENLLPPIQFVYYWQLFCKLTKEDPFLVLDKFFIRPMFLQPHLYNLDINLISKLNQGTTNTIVQLNTFINQMRRNADLMLYLDHLMKDQIEYCEIYPLNTNKYINGQAVLFHFFNNSPGNFVTFSNILFDRNNANISEMNKFELSQIVFEFVQSQCLVCIDKDRSLNKNWLLSLDKVPENSIPIIQECFRVLISESFEQKNSPKKNGFSTFYEESNISSMNQNNQQQQTNSAENDMNNKNSENSENGSNLKASKKLFLKPIFKFKSHSKKDKEEDKKGSNSKKNENENTKNTSDSYLSQINLYINMRKLPINYLSMLEIIFEMKINSINLIFTPIGILHEIDTEIINNNNAENGTNNNNSNKYNHVKVISDIDKEKDIFVPFHISTTKIQCNCKVNDNIGSIGFFQEFIVITSCESFRGQQYPVTTVSSYAQFRLPKIISKTAIEIEFQFDKCFTQSPIVTNILGKKLSSIVLDFGLDNVMNNNLDKNVFLKVSPEFIIEAMQSSTGSTIGDQKVATLPLSRNIDSKISMIALSLFYVSNIDSVASETALELFWLVVQSFNQQKSNQTYESKTKEMNLNLVPNLIQLNSFSNSLYLPFDGFVHVLNGIYYNNGCKETTLFSSVAQYLSNFLSTPKNDAMQIMPLLSIILAFISTSNDQAVLSGICHNLLRQFNQKVVENSQNIDSNDLAIKKVNESTQIDYFQFLQIWSTVSSSSFTTIALPQILIYVPSSVVQSQLIHCLTAKNKKVVNDVLIQNLLYKDLVSFRLYSPICSNGLYKIFPLIQFLGRPDIILFLNLTVALTAPNESAQPFIESIKSFLVYYEKNKQIMSQSSQFNQEMIDSMNEEINDDEDKGNVIISSVDFASSATTNINNVSLHNSVSNFLYTEDNNNDNKNNNDDGFSNLDFNEMFDPEISNILDSAQKILSFFDQKLQNSVNNLFETLTKAENSKVWYLKPSLSTTELLDAMTESIVPRLNLKKLSFCITSFSNHKNDLFSLFWVALPYLFSQYSFIVRLSIYFITNIFSVASKNNEELTDNFIDPFEEFLKVLNKSKNLQIFLRTFGDSTGINFEENLPIAFALILINILSNDDKNRASIHRLLYLICLTYKKQPSKSLEFVLILIVFTNKLKLSFFNKIGSQSNTDNNYFLAFSNYLKETSPLCSRFRILWMLNFLVWAFSKSTDNNKFQIFTIVLYEIMKVRKDLPKVMKTKLIHRFKKFTDNKDQNIQEYLAFIFAIANSSPNEENNQTSNNQKSNIDQLEKLLWVPKVNVLVEQHLYSFCVNFHAAVKNIINGKP